MFIYYCLFLTEIQRAPLEQISLRIKMLDIFKTTKVQVMYHMYLNFQEHSELFLKIWEIFWFIRGVCFRLLFFQVAISLSPSISIHGKISDFIGGLCFMLLFLHEAISLYPWKDLWFYWCGMLWLAGGAGAATGAPGGGVHPGSPQTPAGPRSFGWGGCKKSFVILCLSYLRIWIKAAF